MRGRATTDSQGIAVYTIRIERDKLERLHEIAEVEHRTLAGHIRLLFEREIADHAKAAA